MPYFVYILKSEKTLKYYIGQTENLVERIKRHNENMVPSTRNKGPWLMVYFEECDTRAEAMKREMEIKKKKSRIYIEKLIKSKV